MLSVYGNLTLMNPARATRNVLFEPVLVSPACSQTENRARGGVATRNSEASRILFAHSAELIITKHNVLPPTTLLFRHQDSCEFYHPPMAQMWDEVWHAEAKQIWWDNLELKLVGRQPVWNYAHDHQNDYDLLSG